MLIRNTKKVSVDEVQGYLSRGARIHPLLYAEFLHHLIELQNKGKLSILPQTKLEIYSKRVAEKIADRLYKLTA